MIYIVQVSDKEYFNSKSKLEDDPTILLKIIINFFRITLIWPLTV